VTLTYLAREGGLRPQRMKRGRYGPRKTLLALIVLSVAGFPAAGLGWGASGSGLQDEVSQREANGDLAGARSLLEEAAGKPDNSAGAAALAEFLERHEDRGSRDAYLKWAAEEKDPAIRKLALREVVLLDFKDGSREEIAGDLQRYREAGGDEYEPVARQLGLAASVDACDARSAAETFAAVKGAVRTRAPVASKERVYTTSPSPSWTRCSMASGISGATDASSGAARAARSRAVIQSSERNSATRGPVSSLRTVNTNSSGRTAARRARWSNNSRLVSSAQWTSSITTMVGPG